MSFSPFFYQAVQINRMQQHPNLSESKCFLCQDIKCCNAFRFLFPWRITCWLGGGFGGSSLEYSLPQCGLHGILPQPLLGPWEAGHPAQHLTWLLNPWASLVQAAPGGKSNTQKNPQKGSRVRPGDKCQGTDFLSMPILLVSLTEILSQCYPAITYDLYKQQFTFLLCQHSPNP